MATLGRLLTGLRRFICGIYGHETLLHFDRRHVSLVCLNCGYESPGWNMPGAPAAPGGTRHTGQASPTSRPVSTRSANAFG